ncbi:rhomboid family intramembrane serine protease [Candidatus Woesearchaeota archaeon]|nr:rhomboid family intramembrane serine protease [Candidatus Woesearchaeota archaeon]
MRKAVIVVITVFIIVISSLVYLLIPNSVNTLAFSGEAFLRGELYRLVTFPFSHENLFHLVENIVALSVIALLAYELHFHGFDFLLVFFGAGLLLAFADLLFFPAIILAGTSLGIYAVLGTLVLKGDKFLPKKLMIPLLIFSIFSKLLYDLYTCQSCITQETVNQALFHFFGFGTGMIICVMIKGMKERKVAFLYSDDD